MRVSEVSVIYKYILHKCKGMRVNMEDEELVKMFNPTLKIRETILFFLIVVINGLFYFIISTKSTER